jgi:hypothetical protein
MKSNKFILGLGAMSILFFGCQKLSTTTATDTSIPTSDEAASTVGASISSNGYGLSAQLTDAIGPSQTGKFALSPSGSANNQIQISRNVEVAASIAPPCGFTKDTIMTRSNADTATFHYSFYLNYKFAVNCTANAFSGFTFSDSTAGTYVGPRLSYNGNSTMNTVLSIPTGSGDSVLVFNGNFNHNGTTTSKVGNKATFTSQLTLTLVNLTIGRTSHIIDSGTGTITLTGTSSTGKSFTYTGTVDFSTRNQLVVNILGKIYHFDLRSGNELSGS